MKKIFLLTVMLPLLALLYSCSFYDAREKAMERCEQCIADDYNYSWIEFENIMVKSKVLTVILSKNPLSTDTLFFLYQSLSELSNFEAEYLKDGNRHSVDWFTLRDKFYEKINKLKIDLSKKSTGDGLSDSQYKSLIYLEFYNDLVELENTISRELIRKYNLINFFYICP